MLEERWDVQTVYRSTYNHSIKILLVEHRHSTDWGDWIKSTTIKSNQIKLLAFGDRGNRTARYRNNKLNPNETPSPGMEPGPHWWKRALSPLRHPCSQSTLDLSMTARSSMSKTVHYHVPYPSHLTSNPLYLKSKWRARALEIWKSYSYSNSKSISNRKAYTVFVVQGTCSVCTLGRRGFHYNVQKRRHFLFLFL